MKLTEEQEIAAFAMHSALLVQFIHSNRDNPLMSKDYVLAAVEQLEQNIPIILYAYLAEWFDTPEGIEWRTAMGLPTGGQTWEQFLASHSELDFDQ